MGLRVLILSRTPIGERMSSPGIRYANMRRVLKAALPDAEIDLATPGGAGSADGLIHYHPLTALGLVREYDVVIGMSFPMSVTVAAAFFRKPVLVLDFFSQFHFEWMEVGRDLYRGLHRRIWTRAGQLYANLQLLLADYVACANERQRDAYIGVMASLGLLTVRTYEKDSTLRGLIDVVPHGIRPEVFPEGSGGVKGVYPGIDKSDRLLLWLGGVLYWYDPITLLRALHRARKSHPELKLLFLGTNYPGDDRLGQGLRLRQAIAEAKRLGMWEDGVYVHGDWLPHADVTRFLQDADAGVATYFTNAETRFAHRTRFQDYIWARLPIICTRGDVLADEVDSRGWGLAVPERDEESLYAALMRVAEDDAWLASCRAHLAEAAARMSWESAFEPLVRFLKRLEGGARPLTEPRPTRAPQILRSAAVYLAVRLLERAALKAQQIAVRAN